MACATADYYLKRGDTARAIQATLYDPDSAVVDLSTATSVQFLMRSKGGAAGSAPKVSAPATVVTAASGIVRYDWVAADTNAVGDYYAEWEVTWASGGKDTYPSSGYNLVRIAQDLDSA